MNATMQDKPSKTTEPGDSLNRPGSVYFPLFKHMSDNHGLTLLDSEMEDICRVVEEVRGVQLNIRASNNVLLMSALEAMSGLHSDSERAKFTLALYGRLKKLEAIDPSPNTELSSERAAEPQTTNRSGRPPSAEVIGSAMFNSDQQEYMVHLSNLPAAAKCWCGWYLLGECSNCATYAPGKTCADKMAVWCPECHNDPGPNGGTITHIKGCKQNKDYTTGVA